MQRRIRLPWLAAALAVVLGGGATAPSQVVNPADAQARPQDAATPGDARSPRDASSPSTAPGGGPGGYAERLRSWQLPAITVLGEPAPELLEEERVGAYEQPRWTATRRFPGTRIYVVPEGKMEFEYWLRPTLRKGEPTEVRHLWEVEIGLPHRFQLDLYYRLDQEGDESEFLIGEQIELRYALADWGVLWGNPTLYIEWVSLERRPDKIEPKLLLGGEIAPRWHWGLNLVGEFELGGEKEYEYAATGGLSYAVLDSRLSVGVETIFSLADGAGSRGDFSESESLLIGPSIQLKPTPQATLNIAPLFGVTDDSPDAQILINFGYEL